MTSPAAIPTPPNNGVARSCQRAPVGTATSRPPSDGERSSVQSTTEATGSAASVMAASTGDHCRGRFSPTIARGERVRRRLAVPGAVLEPRAPRPAGEVQGLGARPGVDARAAGRADARLPRRLLRPLEGAGDRSRRLLAVPALRPPAVGVLRLVAADRRAQPRRERAPDPEGALPAPARPALRRRHPGGRLRGDDRDRPRPLVVVPAGQPRRRVAGAAGGRPDRRVRRRLLARGRGAERDLPRRRVRGRRGAPAVVLPDARPVPARRPARARSRGRGSST